MGPEPAAAHPAPADAAEGRTAIFLRLAALCVISATLYGALFLLEEGGAGPIPESVKVGVPFLLVPFIVLRFAGQPPDLGRLDRGFAFSTLAYAPFAVWLVAAIPSSPSTFEPGRRAVEAGGLIIAAWAVDTFFHVGAVDYFTKRVIQHEAEALFGWRWGLALQLLAWSLGHILEWLWLRAALGEAGAAAFLILAGAVTGWAYLKWKNVGGLMVGHFLLNVTVSVAAIGQPM